MALTTPPVDAAAAAAYDALLMSNIKLVFRNESSPGFNKKAPEAACATFTLHAEGAEAAVARFAVHATKPFETEPYMEHTVRVTLADGRLVGTVSNAGGSVAPPPNSEVMDRDGAAGVSVAPLASPLGCNSNAACAANGALWRADIARASAEKQNVQLVVEPGQKAVDNYAYLIYCVALPTCCAGPVCLMCCTHSPPIAQSLQSTDGTVLPGRLVSVWEGPQMCKPRPRKEVEFPEGMAVRLRADLVLMAVAIEAIQAVSPNLG